jgi:environmental stress-induced protein Ves
MPRATLLKASTYRRMPWKNGGGETVEIAISPEGATVSDFDWRISMATVAADGPFSIFPEIDRTLSILQGHGMALTIDSRAPVLLTQESDPLAFPADVPVSATLADGPITDLNVMTRRAGPRHHVERASIDGEGDVEVNAPVWLVLCHSGSLTARWSDQIAELSQGDTLRLENCAGARVALAGQSLCYIISIGDEGEM